jgi:hypothetical protein
MICVSDDSFTRDGSNIFCLGSPCPCTQADILPALNNLSNGSSMKSGYFMATKNLGSRKSIHLKKMFWIIFRV